MTVVSQVDALAAAAVRHNLEAEAVTTSLAGTGVQRSDEVLDVEQAGGGLDGPQSEGLEAPESDAGPPGKKSGCACTIM